MSILINNNTIPCVQELTIGATIVDGGLGTVGSSGKFFVPPQESTGSGTQATGSGTIDIIDDNQVVGTITYVNGTVTDIDYDPGFTPPEGYYQLVKGRATGKKRKFP